MANEYRHLVELPERGYHSFRHYFLPHEENNHHPLVLRPTALKVYSAVLIAMKVMLTGFLYIAYPTEAQFAELTASKIFELTNSARSANDVPALKLNAQLSRAAQAKARDMLRLGYFDHTGPDGKKFWQWIKESGYSYSTAGENLAMDFTTAESAHRALMASASHRTNILKATYTEVGLAVAEGSMNGRDTTVLVEFFGSPAAKRIATARPAAPAPAPSPAPTAAPATAPAGITYRAQVVGLSDEKFILLTGSEVSAWVDFKNTGTAVWRNNTATFIALNVTNPPGRASPFAHASWPAAYRPGRLSQATVKPGQTGRFFFTLKAPPTIGSYTESFGLVAENVRWVEDGSVTVPIMVVAPQPTVAAAETETPQAGVQQEFDTTSVTAPTDPETGAVEPADESQPSPLVVALPTSGGDWQRIAAEWMMRLFWAFLIFLSAVLILTIVVRIRVQHRHVILQTLLVIVLTAFMILVPFHYAERISTILVN